MTLRVISRDMVRDNLDFPACMTVVREAMIALSAGEGVNVPRQIVGLAKSRAFGVMAGGLGDSAPFGAKLVSVYPENFELGLQSHQGIVALFDPESGAPVAIVHAGEITAIRTAAASAVATQRLARADASTLAVLGYGEQAEAHVHAIATIRPISALTIWGRDPARREHFARHIAEATGLSCRTAPDVRSAVAEADIICTTTAADEPILAGAWVAPGTHVNVVGSSRAGPAEVDSVLVLRSRYFVDYRPSVLAQGSEFLRAKAAGLIGDDHIQAEIGEVLAATKPGRRDNQEITVYKSLGHIAQDLASAWHVYDRISRASELPALPF
jgi:ornithine cyclodeaminase